MKNAYVVMCHRIDCGDEEVFQLEPGGGSCWWPTLREARKAMKEDYKRMCEEWTLGRTLSTGWRACKDEIRVDVPCANVSNGAITTDWIRCRWKVVKV